MDAEMNKAKSSADAGGAVTDAATSGGVKVDTIRVPALGETVLVDTGREYNGSRIHPGVVVRTWSGLCVNVRVLVDGAEVLWLTSCSHVSQVGRPSSFMQARPVYWFFPWERALN